MLIDQYIKYWRATPFIRAPFKRQIRFRMILNTRKNRHTLTPNILFKKNLIKAAAEITLDILNRNKSILYKPDVIRQSMLSGISSPTTVPEKSDGKIWKAKHAALFFLPTNRNTHPFKKPSPIVQYRICILEVDVIITNNYDQCISVGVQNE